MPHLAGKSEKGESKKSERLEGFETPKNPNTTVQADSRMMHGSKGTGNAAIDSSSKNPESHSGSYDNNKMFR